VAETVVLEKALSVALLMASRGYPNEAGYDRWGGGWRVDLSRPVGCREGLPSGGWRRVVTLMGAFVAALLLPNEYPGISRT
jgi:hypothetical protein